MEYIIMAKTSGGFWNGDGWSSEYPDARVYGSVKKALVVAKRAATETQAGVDVVKHYGFSNETICASVSR